MKNTKYKIKKQKEKMNNKDKIEKCRNFLQLLCIIMYNGKVLATRDVAM